MRGELETTTNPHQIGRLSMIPLGKVTKMLRRATRLRGSVYVVGKIITEGQTLHDINIIVTDTQDITRLKDVLGKYSSRTDFILQKKPPQARPMIQIF